jgi:hypothetical protein
MGMSQAWILGSRNKNKGEAKCLGSSIPNSPIFVSGATWLTASSGIEYAILTFS